MADALDRGREAFSRRAWGEAQVRLSDADRQAALEAEDLERLAIASYLVGDDDASGDASAARTSGVAAGWRRATGRTLPRSGSASG